MAQQKTRNRKLRQQWVETHTGGKDKVALARIFANRAAEALIGSDPKEMRYFKQDVRLFKLMCSMALPSCMMADRSIQLKKGYDKDTGEVHVENKRNKKAKKETKTETAKAEVESKVVNATNETSA